MTTEPRWSAHGNAVFEGKGRPARIICYDDDGRTSRGRYELAQIVADALNALDAAGADTGHDSRPNGAWSGAPVPPSVTVTTSNRALDAAGSDTGHD